MVYHVWGLEFGWSESTLWYIHDLAIVAVNFDLIGNEFYCAKNVKEETKSHSPNFIRLNNYPNYKEDRRGKFKHHWQAISIVGRILELLS